MNEWNSQSITYSFNVPSILKKWRGYALKFSLLSSHPLNGRDTLFHFLWQSYVVWFGHIHTATTQSPRAPSQLRKQQKQLVQTQSKHLVAIKKKKKKAPKGWCQESGMRVPSLMDGSPQKDKPLFWFTVNHNSAFQPKKPPRIQSSPNPGAVKGCSCAIFLALHVMIQGWVGES